METQETKEIQDMENQVMEFDVKKSGYIGKTYWIKGSSYDITATAKISWINRIILKIIYISCMFSIGLYFLYVFSRGVSIIVFLPVPLILCLFVILYFFVGIRRIPVQVCYFGRETSLGMIKGNLFFTKWKITDVTGQPDMTLNFSIIGFQGKFHTPAGILRVKGVSKSTFRHSHIIVVNSNDEIVFSIYPQDSVYDRNRFSITLEGNLHPILVTFTSVCLIERFYRPKSRPKSDGP